MTKQSANDIYHDIYHSEVRDVKQYATAKIFRHGRSQAVRLPKEFRLPGKEVRVRRFGKGVLLEPTAVDLKAIFAAMDRIKAPPLRRPRQPRPQVRKLFD